MNDLNGLTDSMTVSKIETFPVYILKNGEIFGEEDIYDYKPGTKCSVRVKCISNSAHVFVIKADEFVKNFLNDRDINKYINQIV